MGLVLPFPEPLSDLAQKAKSTGHRPLTFAESKMQDNLIEKFARSLRVTRANSKKTVEGALHKINSAISFIGKPVWLWQEADVDEFLLHKLDVDNIAPGTMSGYRTYLNKLQRFLTSSKDLKKLILNEFGVEPGRFMSEIAPISLRNKSKKKQKTQVALTIEECEIVIDYIEYEIEKAESWDLLRLQRDKTIFITLVTMGLRVSELVKIKVNDLIVLQEKDCGPIYSSLQVVGKGGVARCIEVISEITSDVLAWYIKDIRWAFLKNKDASSEWLFYSERGTTLSTERVRNIISNYCSMAGIETKITPHNLRHTYTTLIMPKIGASATQRQLGHSNLSTTFGVYYHPNHREILNKINVAASKKIQNARRRNS
ncbi:MULTISPECIES: tyrosine-type recombinase/integrase [Deefgea]|uniref:Tyrosine-type recombinase/integrase n=1 Tax=Deefgea chitinilytica TaxID=570276 RepID=A0ABS2CD73_9NEIS|nr:MULTISPECIES: tyrosine-type recombinase/integrase [Deefgea]MBM5572104.1 tyrosine-type recombinase/integrase [Deefgea chitinilytica]MBM9889339.1 tyrosine-type recombinase/integrase [Deefgea sp. CFH1-16]